MSENNSNALSNCDSISKEACGIRIICCKKRFSYPIPCLNGFASLNSMLILLCLGVIGQGFVLYGLIGISISTLEKRFHLQSADTGFIASCYDIGTCLSCLWVAHFGGKGNKPLWIGCGMLLFGTGSIIFALPHFAAPPYIIGEDTQHICNVSVVTEKCLPSSLRNYMVFFIVGQLLHGIGGNALLTLGLTYIDDNVSQVKSSLYQGIFLASSVLGPVLGFLVGGQLLTVFTNITESVNITQNNSQWIGAWWFGFLLGGCFVILSAIPILLLPNHLPNTGHLRINRETETFPNKHSANSTEEPASKSSLRTSLVVVLTNPVYFLGLLADSTSFGVIASLNVFGPKYVELMFRLTPSQTAIYFGALVVFSAAIGQFFGGFIVTKLKLKVGGILKFCIILSVLTAFTSFFVLIRCPDIDFAGATVPYLNENTTSLNNFISSCNEFCHCNHDLYDPICGDDAVTYYSPCYAGCSYTNSSNDAQLYFNCSCIQSAYGIATEGKCRPDDCFTLPFFLTLFVFATITTYLHFTPSIQLLLRVVPFVQRSLGLGIRGLIIRLLGSIPIPILFGKVLDFTCVVWSRECGTTGACEFYKNSQFSSYIGVLIGSIKVMTVVFYVVAFLKYTPTLNEVDSKSVPEENPFIVNESGAHFDDVKA